MYKTIEAIYRDGSVFPLKDEIPVRYAKILITFLSENETVSGMSGHILKKYQGILKNFHDDPVEYQRRLRDEW